MKIKKSVQDTLFRFHYQTLRKPQIKPINFILEHKDVFVIAPTSSGKSLIYQIPAAMHEDRLTLVIEPTIALMHDQVQKLKRLGIAAEYIDSTVCATERKIILKDVSDERVSILYITPERLQAFDFLDAIKERDIYMIVVDECHCVLQWGISFRPAYLYIKEFIESLDTRPITVALTATATPEERQKIKKLLSMKKAKECINSIDRSNLILLKERIPLLDHMKAGDQEKLFQYKLKRLKYNIKRFHHNGSMIVYCSTRKHTDAVFNYLKKQFPEQIVRCHSNMKPRIRAKHEVQFLNNEKTIMVATSAFGMGIDKGDIDLVIHFDMPLSIGDYYQQAGRAGRDGNDAHCVMLYSDMDIKIGEALLKKQEEEAQAYMREQLEKMWHFIMATLSRPRTKNFA